MDFEINCKALMASFKQVVGGSDENLPSLPSTLQVKVISYLKLLSEVSAVSLISLKRSSLSP